jgi:hypothetical protein
VDLLLIIAELDPAGKPRDKRTFTCPRGSASVGAAAGCDVRLPGLAEVSFALNRDDHGDLVLARRDPAVDLRRDGQPLTDHAVVRNGDRLQVPGYDIHVVVRFTPARQGRAAGFTPVIMATLVGLVMAAEVAVATWLPREISRRHFWGEELARQQVLTRVDVLRVGLFMLARKNRNPYVLQTVALARTEVDKLALHLRQHQGPLTPTQIRDLGQDLDRYETVLEQLRNGTLFPPETQLNLEPTVQQLLKEKTTP